MRFAYFVVAPSSPLLRFLSLFAANSGNSRKEAHQAQSQAVPGTSESNQRRPRSPVAVGRDAPITVILGDGLLVGSTVPVWLQAMIYVSAHSSWV